MVGGFPILESESGTDITHFLGNFRARNVCSWFCHYNVIEGWNVENGREIIFIYSQCASRIHIGSRLLINTC